MTSAASLQDNFQAGEWSPSRQGSMADPRYKQALAKCLNYIPTTEGSLRPRSGFRRLGISSFTNDAILLPFRFSAVESYVCEFNTSVLRLWANGQLIIQDSLTIASVSTGGAPVFTMSSNFPSTWTAQTSPTVKIHFSTIAAMEKAPFLCNREFLLNITGANTATLTDAETAAPLTTPVSGTFTARMDLVFNFPIPTNIGALEVVATEDVRILQYTSQKLFENSQFASAVDHKASIIAPQFPPITFSMSRGVLNPIYEQFIDGPYYDSIGDKIPVTVSGVSGDITVTLNAYNSAFTYNQGDLVFSGGNLFVSLINSNTGNVIPAVANDFWALVPVAWNSGTTYALGIPSTDTPTTLGIPTVYYSLNASNTNHDPTTSPTFWSTTPPTYAGGTTYTVGAVVVSAGIKYVSIQAANVGNTPASSPTFWLPVNFEAAVAGVTSTTTGQAAANRFAQSDASDTAPSTDPVLGLAGRLIRLKVGPEPWSNKTTYAIGNLVNFGNVIFKSLTNSNLNNQPDTDPVNWEAQALTIQWTWGMIKTYNSPYQAVVTILGDDLRNNDTVWEYRLGLYSDTTGWPSSGAYHEGRVVLSSFTQTRESSDTLSTVRSPGLPNRIDMSQPDQGFSFSPTAADGTVTDGSAIAMQLNAAGNEHVQTIASSVDGIFASTDMGEWIVCASNLNDPLTPTDVQAKNVTNFTGAQAGAQKLLSSIAFVQGNRRRLIEYKSFVDVTAYQVRPNGADLTKDCQHLTVNGIGHIEFQRIPQPVIWCSTGQKEAFCHRHDYGHQLFGIGYSRGPDETYIAPFSIEHGLELFFNQQIDTRSIAVQYGTDDTKEFLYRTGGGFVEYLEPCFDTSGPSDYITIQYAPTHLAANQRLLADSCFLDSAVSPCGFKEAPDNTGVTFYGLYPHRNIPVSFVIMGKYIGEFTPDSNGTVFVPFTNGASSTAFENGAFSIYDCGQACVGTNSPLVLPDFHQEFLFDDATDSFGPDPGDFDTITKFCGYFGYKYRRRGQLLRPLLGSQNGQTPFGKTIRVTRAAFLLDTAHEISIGTDFSNLEPLPLTKDGNKDVSPLGVSDFVNGNVYRDFVKDDYSYNGQVAWEQTEPYPGAILAVGSFYEVNDV